MKSRSIHLSLVLCMAAVFGTDVFFSARPLSAEDFDWRNVNGLNWLTPVKDQFGGTCWDFAGCGVIEAKYMLTRNDNTYQPDVSEQQINWETNPDMGNSVDGGNTYKVMDYFVNRGVVLESEIPTVGTDNRGPGDPWYTSSSNYFKATSDDTYIAQGTDINHVKWALKMYGPLAIHLEADSDWYDPPPGTDRGGHMVVLVGFHDNLPGENAPGGGYWIIREQLGIGMERRWIRRDRLRLAAFLRGLFLDSAFPPIQPRRGRS